MPVRVVYASAVLLLLLIEIAIAIGAIGGTFIRESVGDLLVIMLIYFFLRAAFNLATGPAAALALATGVMAELLQYVHVAELLGLKQGSLLYILIGNTYSSLDLLMYLLGALLAFVIDQYGILPRMSRQAPSQNPG